MIHKYYVAPKLPVCQMTRFAVIDTETTGLNKDNDDRIIDIAAVLLDDRTLVNPNGQYSQLCNPQRKIPKEAFRVHKISDDRVANEPLFKEIVDDFLAFIQGRTLIIHNASYDLMMIDQEFSYFRPDFEFSSHFEVIDTIALARKEHPRSRYSLNNLLKMYDIYDENREIDGHSALHDCELLAQLYLKLTGGQNTLEITTAHQEEMSAVENKIDTTGQIAVKLEQKDKQAHDQFMQFLQQNSSE